LIRTLTISSDSEKRVHQGWGGDDGNRELQNEEQAVADATAETTTLAPGDDWTGAAPPTGTDDWAGAGTTDDAAWGAPIEGAAAPAAETTEPAKAEGGEYRRRRRDDEPEEDDNTLTLDQYLAKKKESESSLLPKLEGPRKVEGDDKLWKNAVPVNKPEDDSYFVGKVRPDLLLLPICLLITFVDQVCPQGEGQESRERIHRD
jgi:plasminogen activator inhibitor 1 RNA-binding protein